MRHARSYTSQYGTPETTSYAVAAMKQMRRLLVPGIIAALTSCGGSNAVTAPPNPLANVIGTYALTQFNGNNMLRTFTQADLNRPVIVAGMLLLRDNNTFTLKLTQAVIYSQGFINSPGPTPLPGFFGGLLSGTYMMSGSSITLNAQGFTGNGGVDLGMLTFNVPTNGDLYTFQKE